MMPNRNVLLYARHHGLTIDHHGDLLQQVASDLTQDLENLGSHKNGATWEADLVSLFHAFSSPRNPLVDPGTHITIEQCQCLQEIITPPLTDLRFNSSQAWRDLLPNHNRIRELYLELPLLHIGGGNVHKDIERLRRSTNVSNLLGDICKTWEASSEQHALTGYDDAQFTMAVRRSVDRVELEVRSEKLVVSERAFELLMSIKISGNVTQLPPDTLKNSLPRLNSHETCADFPSLDLQEYFEHDNLPTNENKHLVPEPSPCSQGQNKVDEYDNLMEVDELVQSINEFEATQNTSVFHPIKHDIEDKIVLQGETDIYRSRLPNLCSIASDDVAVQKEIKVNDKAGIPGQPGNSYAASVNLFKDVKDIPACDNTNDCISKNERVFPDLLLKLESEIDCALIKSHSSRRLQKEYGNVSDSVAEIMPLEHCRNNIAPQTAIKKIISNIASVPLDSFRRSKTVLLEKMLDEQHHSVRGDMLLEQDPRWATITTEPRSKVQAQPIAGNINYLDQQVSGAAQPVQSDQLLWNSPGLKVFSGVKAVEFTDTYLTRLNKDKTELSKYLLSDAPLSQEKICISSDEDLHKPQSKFTTSIMSKATKLTKERPIEASHVCKSAGEIGKASSFSAPESLAAFLDLRGRKYVMAKMHWNSATPELKEDPIEPTQANEIPFCNPTALHTDIQVTLDPAAMATTRPIPEFPAYQPLLGSRTIILNNKLIQSDPDLVKFCERSGENLLKIIYRDFTRLDVVDPDIILGPRSCLITINIQAFQQRCLPGQENRSKFSKGHEKLLNFGQNYDLVIMLVTCASQEMANLATINTLSAVCSSYNADHQLEIKPVYVPYNSPEMLKEGLQAWTWAAITQYAFPDPPLLASNLDMSQAALLQEETTWELFLRKAGMNIFSAQQVLNLLKNSQLFQQRRTCSLLSHAEPGLSRFIRMSCEERMKVLGYILGARAIERVNFIVEGNDRQIRE